MPVIYVILSFVYILLIIEPVLHFHYRQPPFLFAGHFFTRYTNHPGGISELIANFIIQSFYTNYFGGIVFILVALVLWILVNTLLNVIYRSKMNLIWAFIPFTFVIALSNKIKEVLLFLLMVCH